MGVRAAAAVGQSAADRNLGSRGNMTAAVTGRSGQGQISVKLILIGAARPKARRQHYQGQHQEEQHTDLPRLMRQQPLRRERHQEGAERPRGRDDPQRLAAPLFRHRARRRGHRQ